jgi:hypothetical protein
VAKPLELSSLKWPFVGLAALLALFGAGLALAVRGRRVIAAAWLVLVVWLWTAQSFVAGIPLDAVTWLGFGLVAAGAARMRT